VIDDEKVKLFGRIDAYDPDKLEIIELKSTKIFDNTRLPRLKNVLQLQCYGIIFKNIFSVKELTLVYVDMDIFEKHSVPFVDKRDWIEEKIQVLYKAIRDSKPPSGEESFECNVCPYSRKCSVLKQAATIISQTPSKKTGA
jgi:CRISPR/Cas system-associated exonuclease Cas4 (RecB family)